MALVNFLWSEVVDFNIKFKKSLTRDKLQVTARREVLSLSLSFLRDTVLIKTSVKLSQQKTNADWIQVFWLPTSSQNNFRYSSKTQIDLENNSQQIWFDSLSRAWRGKSTRQHWASKVFWRWLRQFHSGVFDFPEIFHGNFPWDDSMENRHNGK